MSEIIKRGYFKSDIEDFSDDSIKILNSASKDLYYLLNRGYKLSVALTFVGNHFMLSKRQRLALARSVTSYEKVIERKNKEVIENIDGKIVHIDGFNTIITLEVALSNSLLLKCMDENIRDLASLKGTYNVIDETIKAIFCIGKFLHNKNIDKAIFYLDSPVSNSGKLKEEILNILILGNYWFDIDVKLVHNVDKILENLDNVITSDTIILDKCKSWINMNKYIIENEIKSDFLIDFSKF